MTAQLKGKPGLTEAIKQKNNSSATTVKSSPGYQKTAASAQSALFNTITVGGLVAGDVIFIGGSLENGLSIDFGDDRPAEYYASTSYKIGPALGGDIGLNVGLWTDQSNKLSGNLHGWVYTLDTFVKIAKISRGKELSKIFSFKAGPTVALAVWFDYNLNFKGLTITPTVSKGFDFGGYARSGTLQTF